MSQKGLVLRLLREAGPAGVSAHTLNYQYGITRAAAVVFDLRADGHYVDTLYEGKLEDGRQRMARYVLRDRPTMARAAPPPEELHPTPEPRELALPCGCRRDAGGMHWLERCAQHGSYVQTTMEEVQW